MKNNNLTFFSNKEEFIFDHDNLRSLTPYFYFEEDVIASGLFIESIEKNDECIFIRGWCFGAEITLKNISDDDYIFRKYERNDVASEFNISYEKPGFTLQVNIVDKQLDINFRDIEVNIDYGFLLNNERHIEYNEFKPISNELLIVGGAPSITSYLENIKEYNGEIWALNDSIFWLEDNGIKVDKLVVADQRFVDKQIEKLPLISCNDLILADYIDLKSINKRQFKVKVLGRDGVSERFGEAYHGCTVANLALQTARLANYKTINTVGILLHFPTAYERIDGSKTMPEFVHKTQIKNIKNTVHKIRKDRIELIAFEPSSNINFF